MIGRHTHRMPSPPVLGAPLDISVDAHPSATEQVERTMVDEIARLLPVFDADDPNSEFSRWRRGELSGCLMSTDLHRVLAASERFWVFSQGAYHPCAGSLTRHWIAAETAGRTPTRDEMHALASTLELPYTAVDGPVRRTGDCARVDLLAMSRGYIIDCAVDVGWSLGIASSITVDIGTSLRHRGAGGCAIDLAAALGAGPVDGSVLPIRLQDAALSTRSCPSRPLGRPCPSTIDPRTGWPNEDLVAAAALAPDAMTAEVQVSVARVAPVGVRTGLPASAWLTLNASGAVSASEAWPLVGRTWFSVG